MGENCATLSMTQIRKPYIAFAWAEISFEAGESPEHLILRKEAERITGSGEFWWGVDAPLGITVEVRAERNGGSLPILFSKSRTTEARQSSQVRIWETWRASFIPNYTVVFPIMWLSQPATIRVRGRLVTHLLVMLTLSYLTEPLAFAT